MDKRKTAKTTATELLLICNNYPEHSLPYKIAYGKLLRMQNNYVSISALEKMQGRIRRACLQSKHYR